MTVSGNASLASVSSASVGFARSRMDLGSSSPMSCRTDLPCRCSCLPFAQCINPGINMPAARFDFLQHRPSMPHDVCLPAQPHAKDRDRDQQRADGEPQPAAFRHIAFLASSVAVLIIQWGDKLCAVNSALARKVANVLRMYCPEILPASTSRIQASNCPSRRS